MLERHGRATSSCPRRCRGSSLPAWTRFRREEKELLQDAAVVGRVFWLGALGRERWTLEERLHSLERKEFVTRAPQRRRRRGRVRLPPCARPRRRLRADPASGASGQAPSRPPSGSSRSAGSRTTRRCSRTTTRAALEYARVSGQNVEPLAERGRIVLREAGDRAVALNAFASAAGYYRLAVELWPEDDPDRPELLLKLARTFLMTGDDRRQAALEDARDAADRAQRLDLVAQAEALLAELWWYRGDRAACDRHLERAYASVQNLPPSAGKAHVLNQVSRYRMLAGADEEAIRIGESVLTMADELGLVEPQVEALSISVPRDPTRVTSRASTSSSVRSRSRKRRAPPRSHAHPTTWRSSVWALGDLRRGRRLMDEAVAHAERLGLANLRQFSWNVRNWLLAREGHWDEALPPIEEFVAACEAGEPHYHEGGMRLRRAVIRLGRDDVQGALEDLRQIVPLARQAGDPQQRVPWLRGCASLLVEAGHAEEARQLADEVLSPGGIALVDLALVDIALVADELGWADQLATAAELGTPTKWTEAASVIVRGRPRTRSRAPPRDRRRGARVHGSPASGAPTRGRGTPSRSRRTATAVARVLSLGRRDAPHQASRGAPRRGLRDSRVEPARARSPRTAT